VISDSNELAAAGLFIATDGIVQYHLGGTDERYLALAPSKLMLDFVWRWALEESQNVFHLGGGVGGAEDSLFLFKAGFSPERGVFHTYRIVVDELKHEVLNQAARSARGTTVALAREFFPEYRSLDGAVLGGRVLPAAI
jgi:lipid II:glycine glycyltransferase (peptidoglycan interpeptide bridge formation enzyme)